MIPASITAADTLQTLPGMCIALAPPPCLCCPALCTLPEHTPQLAAQGQEGGGLSLRPSGSQSLPQQLVPDMAATQAALEACLAVCQRHSQQAAPGKAHGPYFVVLQQLVEVGSVKCCPALCAPSPGQRAVQSGHLILPLCEFSAWPGSRHAGGCAQC